MNIFFENKKCLLTPQEHFLKYTSLFSRSFLKRDLINKKNANAFFLKIKQSLLPYVLLEIFFEKQYLV